MTFEDIAGAMLENAGDGAVDVFGFEIKSPDEMIDKKIDEGMYPEEARKDYAEYLIEQITAIERDLILQMEDARQQGDKELYNSLVDSWNGIEALKGNVSGGSTTREALREYFSHLDTIGDKAPPTVIATLKT